jgi:hypothetical protein
MRSVAYWQDAATCRRGCFTGPPCVIERSGITRLLEAPAELAALYFVDVRGPVFFGAAAARAAVAREHDRVVIVGEHIFNILVKRPVRDGHRLLGECVQPSPADVRPRDATVAGHVDLEVCEANKRRVLYYDRAVAELRTCTVSYKDVEAVPHTVDVSASSLYEAAVLGLKAFEQTGWSDHPVGEMGITVKSPAVKHRVPVVRVTNWLRAQAPHGGWR